MRNKNSVRSVVRIGPAKAAQRNEGMKAVTQRLMADMRDSLKGFEIRLNRAEAVRLAAEDAKSK